jgi:putative ABC transport system permease protein
MLRPLLREPVRAILTVLAVTLGVAVVLAIDLASVAATGSFRASMETLTGDNNLEILASGGVPEGVVGTLSTLPYAIRISPRIEDSAVIVDTRQTIPLIGLDLVAENSSETNNTLLGLELSPRLGQHLGRQEPRKENRRPNSRAAK